ncbi:MAG: hypothetical protein HYV37_00235 [Candidatus Levyibacteriota bacterium]|nr:MAG: hypothetical protein HYV37_00235 [Candidatus Levybacteria bacterium]
MGFLILLFAEIIVLFFLSRIVARLLLQMFSIRLIALVFLPGIVVHELAHLLVANLLLVKTGHIEFVPQINKHGVKLGSVEIIKTDPIRRMMIGFAPVFVGIAMLFSILYAIIQKDVIAKNITSQPLQVVFYIMAFYFLFVISNTMFSSSKDMEGTAEVLLVVLGIAVALYAVGVRVDYSLLQGILVSQEGILQKAVMLLSFPIVIDLGVWGITKVVSSK